jgi:hypothetical protein
VAAAPTWPTTTGTKGRSGGPVVEGQPTGAASAPTAQGGPTPARRFAPPVTRHAVSHEGVTPSAVTHNAMTGPPLTVPFGERAVGGASVVPGSGLWRGGSLQADTSLTVPLALGGVVFAFIVVQWLIDRRDPKFVEAPARKDDDSIGFD